MTPRRATKRDLSEPLIVKALEEAGCLVYRLDQPVDLLVRAPDGILWLFEVKTPRAQGGRGAALNPSQEAFFRLWAEHAPTLQVVSTPNEALHWFGLKMCPTCDTPREFGALVRVGGELTCRPCRSARAPFGIGDG